MREVLQRTGLLIVVAIVVLGLAATTHAALALRDSKQTQAAQEIQRRSTLSRTVVVDEVNRYLDSLRTVAAALGADDPLSEDQFMATTAGLGDSGFRGTSSMAFIVPASERQTPAVQETWRHAGVPDLTLQPQGDAGEHMYVIYSRVFDARPPTPPGTDLASLAEPTAALNESRRSGQPSLSDTYVLLRDRGLPVDKQELSFVLTTPVYGLPDKSTGQRAFRGWVMMGLRGQDFIGGVLADTAQGQIDAELWATNGNGRTVSVAHLDPIPKADLHHTDTIMVANRQWTLEVSAASHALTGDAVAVAIGGTVVTLLLAGFVWTLATGRARARSQVVAATEEARTAETEAKRQVALLNGILDGISDGVRVVDEDGTFLVHNPAAASIMTIDQHQLGADRWEHYGIFRPDGSRFPVEELPMARALTGVASDKVEMVIRTTARPDGVMLSVSGRPLEVEGRRVAIAVFHDITEQREREGDLAAFAGIVAHDLKNPLTVIASHAEMVSAALDDGVDGITYARESITRVSGGVVRMRRLIDDLLAYTTARDAPLRIQQVDLHALVVDVVGERIDHLRGVKPDVYVGPLPYVDADAGMLQHVLDNLVGNALKYVAQGRTPKIDISATPAQPGWVRVEVADRGIGIPDPDKPRVFDTFHRAHDGSGYGGTGLGLAICRRIVDRHGGTIGVDDNPGGGSRFAFTLPLAATPSLVESPAQESHEYV